jgi:hypothetical protein
LTLRLPDVTVVALDCVAHALTRAALDDTLEQITPHDVMVWSDKNIVANGQRFDCSLTSMREVEECLWYCVPHRVRTSHFLVVQWDGWVVNKDKWNPSWLNCDYIGAPWWYKTLNVGNGGFSLRSTALAKFVANHRDEFPLASPEDQTLCRRYRTRLTKEKFYWASEYEASRFAFERGGPWDTFGFHGLFNFPKVLDPDELQIRLASANKYVRAKVEWQELGIKPDFSVVTSPSASTITLT